MFVHNNHEKILKLVFVIYLVCIVIMVILIFVNKSNRAKLVESEKFRITRVDVSYMIKIVKLGPELLNKILQS